jgi:hypothetical protein
MNPDEVKLIQQRLQVKGLYTGAIDGQLLPRWQQRTAPAKPFAGSEMARRSRSEATRAKRGNAWRFVATGVPAIDAQNERRL